MNVHPINFPVSLIEKNDVNGFSSIEVLKRCYEKDIDSGKMIDTRIVDVKGKQFVIKSVTKIRNMNWLPLFLVPYSKRIVEVEYELSEIDKLSFDEFKELVVDAVKNNPEFTKTGLLQCIKGSETYYELIENTGLN